MRFIRVSRTRAAVVAVIALLLAIGVYAFAASNTVPATEAGSGSGAISGYTVSSVAYGLNATTPTNIDSVTFTAAVAHCDRWPRAGLLPMLWNRPSRVVCGSA